MDNARLSRRTVLASTVAAASLPIPALSRTTLTAGMVVERMEANIGAPWNSRGVDGFKSGSPDTVVTGIGTTMMATFDALKAAARQGLNMVITHEPTYWSHPDTISVLKDDPLYLRKKAFLEAHDMVAFHFHDNWHALRPVDGINFGTQQLMGWTGAMHADNQRMFTIPPTSLLGLARQFERRMGIRTMRVIGDPALPVSTVYESWGYASLFPGVAFLNSAADVLVIGEAQDWDLIGYASDLVASGARKGLIVLGHVKSEQWGMRYCADWLRTAVREVPVRYIPIIEPSWSVDRPVLEIDTRI